MKVFVVHFNLGCCSNNSDGKVWVVAENKESAIEIAEQKANRIHTLVEEFHLENEVLFTTFDNRDFKLCGKTDNWGEWMTPVKEVV